MQPAKTSVYILRSTVDGARYYVGLTGDFQQRLEQHNSGACSHTSKYRPWTLHVRIDFAHENQAVAFEKYLKSGSGRAFAVRHFNLDTQGRVPP